MRIRESVKKDMTAIEGKFKDGKQVYQLKAVDNSGQVISREDFLRNNDLAWTAEKVKGFYEFKEKTFPGTGFEVIRTDSGLSLGNVGDNYNILQPVEIIDSIDAMLQGSQWDYLSGKSLFGGKKIHIRLTTHQEAEVTKGDVIKQFLDYQTSFDGTSKTKIGFTNLRLICENGLTSEEIMEGFSCKHSKLQHGKIADFHKQLEYSNAIFNQFIQKAKLLSAKKINTKMVDDFLVRLELEQKGKTVSDAMKEDFKEGFKFLALKQAVETSPGHEMASGSLWSLVNGVTYYYDHEIPTRESKNGYSVEDTRFNNASFGRTSETKNRAFDLAVAML
jgi:phage/plasmid-like protein (TIGR03299 family)